MRILCETSPIKSKAHKATKSTPTMQVLLTTSPHLLQTHLHRRFNMITCRMGTAMFRYWATFPIRPLHRLAMGGSNPHLCAYVGNSVGANGGEDGEDERVKKGKVVSSTSRRGGVVGASVVLAFVLGLGVVSMGWPMCGPAAASFWGPKPDETKADETLEALLRRSSVRDCNEAKKAFEDLLGKTSRRLNPLKDLARDLEMCPKEREYAIGKLRSIYEKAEAQDADFLYPILVEMLIYQGEYEKAREVLCQHSEKMSGPTAGGPPTMPQGGPPMLEDVAPMFEASDPQLYHAVISVMLAKKYWDKYVEITKTYPPQIKSGQSIDFNGFQTRMLELKAKTEAEKKG